MLSWCRVWADRREYLLWFLTQLGLKYYQSVHRAAKVRRVALNYMCTSLIRLTGGGGVVAVLYCNQWLLNIRYGNSLEKQTDGPHSGGRPVMSYL